MKITLFGGAFDPPHLAHQFIADSIIKQKIADQVWFVPVYKHPWANQLNKTQMSSYAHRLAMISLACSGLTSSIQVAEYHQVSFTLPTIQYFESKNPDHQFSWVMGSEYLSKFDKFLTTHPDLINYPIHIYPRKNFPPNPLYPNMKLIPNVPEVDISSTQIRSLMKNRQPIISLVIPSIANYIQDNQLYLD